VLKIKSLLNIDAVITASAKYGHGIDNLVASIQRNVSDSPKNPTIFHMNLAK
jgi:hypothetical protein